MGQERSIYHATNFAKDDFETIFPCMIRAKMTTGGSLVVAQIRKGDLRLYGPCFSFANSRQGVPGAYRLMANLIAFK